MAPKQALFIRKEWCDKIFDEGKTWELRSFPLSYKKIGSRVVIACSKENLLVGEAELAACFCVGQKSAATGQWVPLSNSKKDISSFFLHPKNAKKVGFTRETMPQVFNNSKQIFAWHLKDVTKYSLPRPWKPKQGAVIFCNL